MSALLDLLYIAGWLALFAFIVYRLLFSPTEEQRRLQAERQQRRFERREAERNDRRQRDLGPPPAQPDRRQGGRR